MSEISTAERLLRITAEERSAVLSRLSSGECAALEHDWDGFWARPNQIIPAGDWENCLCLAGRGWGKTRVGAETVRRWVWHEGRRRIGLIAKNSGDARKVMIEGESGLLNIGPYRERPYFEPSKKQLTWANGAKALVFTDEEPEELRGPQHDCAWVDELAKFRRPDETWDQLQFGLRLGRNPQTVITTTPKPIPLIKRLAADPTTLLLTGTTAENRANLSEKFIRTVIKRYEGTRLGRQELLAEILGDVPGALWSRDQIDKLRVRDKPVGLARVVIAIDPAVTVTEDSDETGIVAAGLSKEGRGYLLDDGSGKYTPGEWANVAVEMYQRWNADLIVAEVNNGGDLVAANLRNLAPGIPVKVVHASRGKAIRAQPIAALYEQGVIHHVGGFGDLEDQLCTWTPLDAGRSPDRLDALVWAFTELFIEQEEREEIVRYDTGYEISSY